MIYAPRGVGKTFFSLGIAYAVATGGQFLKWKAPAPAGVLFLDGEMPGALLQERLAHIVKANPRPENMAPLKIITPDLQSHGMPDLAAETGRESIDRYLDDNIKLIVVDNLSTLARGVKENESDSWMPLQGWALAQRAKGRSVTPLPPCRQGWPATWH